MSHLRIYYRQKIDSFTETFEKCSVIVLLGENYSLLQKDAKKISDALAGKIADEEMRVNKYFNQEINEKRNEIITSLKTKSFFTGGQLLMLNGLYEKDYVNIKESNIGGNLKKHLKGLNKKMKESAANLEFEEAAKIRDEIRKLEASELEITLNPEISQYNLKKKVYPKGRSTLGMPGTKTKKQQKKWKPKK